MLNLGGSIKEEKSFGLINHEPPYTRPAWPVLRKVEGCGGFRGAVATSKSSPVYSIGYRFIILDYGFTFRQF